MTIAELPRLNLPPFDVRLRASSATSDDAEIYDPLRAKWVALTPEEWVRQHFVNLLRTQYGYSEHRLANEVSITLNGTARRCDTVVYDNTLQPLMIIEYKAPHIPLSQKVMDQVARYNMVLGASWLVLSNGLDTRAVRLTPPTYTFLTTFPTYTDLLNNT